jgi:hypothetical protein
LENQRRELIKTIRNLAEIALYLEEDGMFHLLPTVEETLFEQAQKLVMNYDTLEEKIAS